MPIIYLIILFSLVGGILSLIGGILLLYKERLAKSISIYLVSFAAGTLLSVSLLDLLPESLEALEKAGASLEHVFYSLFGGFLFFFIIEGILLRLHHHHVTEDHSHHADEQATKAPELLTIGDTIHNLLDGVAITAAFLINIPTGIITSLAVAAHEIPQEIGDFSVMIHAGWKRKKILLWNIIPAIATTIGALTTYVLRDALEPLIGYFLGFTAGVFLYIAATDLIPEFHHFSRTHMIKKTAPLFFLGVVITISIIRLLESVLHLHG